MIVDLCRRLGYEDGDEFIRASAEDVREALIDAHQTGFKAATVELSAALIERGLDLHLELRDLPE